MKLDPSAPIPLYQQLQEILRMEISSKVRTAGSKLPSEHELCRQFGITRPTVRQALEGLVREGLVLHRRVQAVSCHARACMDLDVEVPVEVGGRQDGQRDVGP